MICSAPFLRRKRREKLREMKRMTLKRSAEDEDEDEESTMKTKRTAEDEEVAMETSYATSPGKGSPDKGSPEKISPEKISPNKATPETVAGGDRSAVVEQPCVKRMKVGIPATLKRPG